MKTIQRICFCAFIAVFSFFFAACGKNLHSTTLKTAVINQVYSDSFIVADDSWSWYDDTVLQVTRGSLPPGIVVTANGLLTGTPLIVGDYSFRISAYTFDTGFWDDDDWWDDSDDVDTDSEWFNLFVTEASSNSLCPNPGDKTYGEIVVCLGSLTFENLEAEDEFELDVNFQTDFDKGDDYDVITVAFSVIYDAALFEVSDEKLNAQTLREAATRAGSGVTFDNTVPGNLGVTITASSQNLHKSGRLMNLPFRAIGDVPLGDYAFVTVIDAIVSKSNHVLPTLVEIDGNVNVLENSVAEEAAQEEIPAEEITQIETEISEDASAENQNEPIE